MAEILLIWASVPCDTVSRLDPSNQRPAYTVRRSTRPEQEACAVRRGRWWWREARGSLRHQRHRSPESVGRCLQFNLYGTHYTCHYAVENPKAAQGLGGKRPVVLAQERRGRLYCRRLDYCQYGHIFAKDTNVWAAIATREPKGTGISGDGKRRAATDYCRRNKKKSGEVNQRTGRQTTPFPHFGFRVV